MRFPKTLMAAIILACVVVRPAIASEPQSPVAGTGPRVFEFSYQLKAAEFPNTEAVDIYIPLPAQHAGQRILHSSSFSVDGKLRIAFDKTPTLLFLSHTLHDCG